MIKKLKKLKKIQIKNTENSINRERGLHKRPQIRKACKWGMVGSELSNQITPSDLANHPTELLEAEATSREAKITKNNNSKQIKLK